MSKVSSTIVRIELREQVPKLSSSFTFLVLANHLPPVLEDLTKLATMKLEEQITIRFKLKAGNHIRLQMKQERNLGEQIDRQQYLDFN